MTANWRPDLWFGLGLNADPNDSTIPVLWNDLTNSLRGATEIARGRQYELGLTQSGEPNFVIDDVNEYLNPDNTSSPYYPDVTPMRQVCLLGIWPNPEAGNLINTAAMMPKPDIEGVTWTVDAEPDPSFESYTDTATAPSWLVPTGSGPPAPTITTTNPQQGTKCVTYDVITDSSEQGILTLVRTIPGRTYTASWYVRQTSASTQRISITDAMVGDTFGRTASSGWGDALLGGTYTTSGGTASDYAVAAGVGTHSCGSVNVIRSTQLGAYTFEDVTIIGAITTSAVASGAAIRAGFTARWADDSNYYRGVISFETDGTVSGYLIKRVAGTDTTIASGAITGLTYTAGAKFWLYFNNNATSLSLRIWPDGDAFPSSSQVSGTDSAITAAGKVGTHSILVTGNTNTPPVTISFDNLTATGDIIGTTTVATNSYQRLSVTFTAGRPVHYIKLATAPSTATAGTINIDAVQIETGSSATAFTTSGSAIYPIWRGYIERVPSSWMHKGYRGWCNLGCVDAIAALTGIPIHSELYTSVITSIPSWYWPLWEPAAAISFAEVSGNDGPALVFNPSKYGGGVAPESGAALNPVGDPGGLGVTITPYSDNSSTHQLATILGAGPLTALTSPSIAAPATIGTSWAMSASVWFTAATTTGGTSWLLDVIRVFPGSLIYRPISLLIGNTNGSVRLDNFVGTTPYTTSRSTSTSGIVVTDGTVHNLVGVITQVNGGNTVVTAYLDGVDCGSTTVTTASIGGMLGGQADSILIGGTETVDTFTTLLSGTIAHVAIWDIALSASDVEDIWDAGGLGRIGETASGRYLNATALYYAGDVDLSTTTRSILSANSANEQTRLLDNLNRVVQSEGGVHWPTADGTLKFESRDDRFLRLTSTYTFGESGAEYPYEEGIAYDLDLTHTYNNIRITRTGGLSQPVKDATSQRRYFALDYAIDVDLESDLMTQDMANWLLSTYKDPHRRIAALTFNPAANGDLWPVMFHLEIGTRVTVTRRSTAANGGTGLTVSKDYFIERIAHEFNLGVEGENVWNVELLLSPANASGGVPQPWILEDATYGILDETTVLGW